MKKIKITTLTLYITGINLVNVYASGLDTKGITSDLNNTFKEINKLFPVIYLIYGFFAFWAMGKVGLEILNASQQSDQAREAAMEKMANLIKLILILPIVFIIIVQVINWIFGTNFEILIKK